MSYEKYSSLTDQEKKQAINDLYVEQNLSLGIIADKLDTYPNKIRRDAIKYGIQLKSKSEAQKNALETGRHKHPTKGSERNEATKSKIGRSVLNKWESLSKEEKKSRSDKARENWEKLPETQKESMLKAANEAVRLSSKTGSKLEKHIFLNLIKDGYKTEFHKEQILATTKLQIDLFLPTLNVAIEVDGPSHFKEVWGKDVLTKNIKYDNKKTGLILGKGFVLIRIKQSMDYSKTRADLIYAKLLGIIQNIEEKFPPNGQREIKIGDTEIL